MPENAVFDHDRSRSLAFTATFPNGAVSTKGDVEKGGSATWKGTQETRSSGHKRSKGVYREGGPFFTASLRANVPLATVKCGPILSGGKTWSYQGLAGTPLPFTTSLALPKDFSSNHLDTYGATAISNVNPTNPNANFGIALGEILRDRKIPIPGIPLWKRRTEIAKAAGSEYLNAVFGWMPLVRDMKDVAQSVRDGNVILQNYHNSDGSFVHREFAFDDEVEQTETQVVANASAIIGSGKSFNANNSLRGPLTARSTKTTRRWFSGAFTHKSFSDSGFSGAKKMLGYGTDADKLFGLTLTPELIWELTPWSWAIDWFSNAGDVISNATALGLAGSVMRYGYMMEETTIVTTYTLDEGAGLVGCLSPIPPATWTLNVKRRRVANPFGFGLTWEGLSPSQLLISAALGITHLR